MFPAVIVFITFDLSILKFTRFQAIFRSKNTEKYGRETEIMIARAASEIPLVLLYVERYNTYFVHNMNQWWSSKMFPPVLKLQTYIPSTLLQGRGYNKIVVSTPSYGALHPVPPNKSTRSLYPRLYLAEARETPRGMRISHRFSTNPCLWRCSSLNTFLKEKIMYMEKTVTCLDYHATSNENINRLDHNPSSYYNLLRQRPAYLVIYQAQNVQKQKAYHLRLKVYHALHTRLPKSINVSRDWVWTTRTVCNNVIIMSSINPSS